MQQVLGPESSNPRTENQNSFFFPAESRFFDLKMVESPRSAGVERSDGAWSIPEYTFCHFATGFRAREDEPAVPETIFLFFPLTALQMLPIS